MGSHNIFFNTSSLSRKWCFNAPEIWKNASVIRTQAMVLCDEFINFAKSGFGVIPGQGMVIRLKNTGLRLEAVAIIQPLTGIKIKNR